MGAANDLLDAFFKEYPQAKEGKFTLEEMNEKMAGLQMAVRLSLTERGSKKIFLTSPR